jgi:phosphatidylglycerophosphate synthase
MNTDFAKDTDGFMARHFDRKISGAISRFLLKTPVTPNQITIAVTILGVFSGVCMAQPGYEPKVLGAALFLGTSILDGCDGEVARAKKMTSKLGGWLDLIGDNVVHVAVFYGLAVGLYKDTGMRAYLLLGIAAVIGTVVSASIAGYQTYRKSRHRPEQENLFTSVVGDARRSPGSPMEARLVRWSDALARRDFIYGVVILALVGRLEWFLWACSIGVNIYAVVLLALLAVTPSRA